MTEYAYDRLEVEELANDFFQCEFQDAVETEVAKVNFLASLFSILKIGSQQHHHVPIPRSCLSGLVSLMKFQPPSAIKAFRDIYWSKRDNNLTVGDFLFRDRIYAGIHAVDRCAKLVTSVNPIQFAQLAVDAVKIENFSELVYFDCIRTVLYESAITVYVDITDIADHIYLLLTVRSMGSSADTKPSNSPIKSCCHAKVVEAIRVMKPEYLHPSTSLDAINYMHSQLTILDKPPGGEAKATTTVPLFLMFQFKRIERTVREMELINLPSETTNPDKVTVYNDLYVPMENPITARFAPPPSEPTQEHSLFETLYQKKQ